MVKDDESLYCDKCDDSITNTENKVFYCDNKAWHPQGFHVCRECWQSYQSKIKKKMKKQTKKEKQRK